MNQKRNIGLDMARVLAIGLVWINHSGDFALGLNPTSGLHRLPSD